MLNPITGSAVIAALASSLIAGSVAWVARGLVFDHIERPAIVRTERAVCDAEVAEAAATATRNEQLRRFKIGEAATQQFITESQEAADDAQARLDLLEMEIKDYAQSVATAGSDVCTLGIGDLELIGVQPQPDRAGGR